MMTTVRFCRLSILQFSANALGGNSSNFGIKKAVCGCRLLQRVSSYNTDTNNRETKEYVQGNPAVSLQSSVKLEKGVGVSSAEQTWRMLIKPDQPPNAKLLRLAIIGRPNCGKSTLTNQLIGLRVSSVSNKVHTTRKRTLGVWTHKETQLVFLDTPGIIEPLKRHRHNLEKSLLTDPHQSLEDADLVAVVVDVSQVWNRTDLDREILKALHMHPTIPSILVLNKVDKVKDKQVLLTTVRRLTEGIVAGKEIVKRKKPKLTKQDLVDSENQHQENENGQIPDHAIDSTPEKQLETTLSDSQSNTDNPSHLHSNNQSHSPQHQDYSDIVNDQSDPSTDTASDRSEELLHTSVDNQLDESWVTLHQRLKEVKKLIRYKHGWSNFDHVFMISALNGDGVNELKDYILGCAKPGDWLYHSSLVTDQDPIEIAKTCVWEKLLDHLREEIPYNLDLDVVYWEVDPSGCLKIAVDVSCSKKRYIRAAMGRGGSTIRDVSVRAEEELSRTFQRKVLLKVMLKLRR